MIVRRPRQPSALVLGGQVGLDEGKRPFSEELRRHRLTNVNLARCGENSSAGIEESSSDHLANTTCTARHQDGLCRRRQRANSLANCIASYRRNAYDRQPNNATYRLRVGDAQARHRDGGDTRDGVDAVLRLDLPHTIRGEVESALHLALLNGWKGHTMLFAVDVAGAIATIRTKPPVFAGNTSDVTLNAFAQLHSWETRVRTYVTQAPDSVPSNLPSRGRNYR